jgi:energy-coupling factor transporter ATP-binding protein EcfA2
LSIQNFRAIGPGPLDLALAPVTLLVGENGAGKSSVLQALALTAQSATERDNRIDLVLSGTKVDFPAAAGEDYRVNAREIYYHKDLDLPLSIGFAARIPEESRRAFPVAPPGTGGPSGKWPPRTVEYRWGRCGSDWPSWSHLVRIDDRTILEFVEKYVRIRKTSASSERTCRLADTEVFFNTSTNRVLPVDPREPWHVVDKSTNKDLADSPSTLVLMAVSDVILDLLRHVQFVTTTRGPGLMHTEVGPDVSFVGTHGEMTIRLLSKIQSKSRPEFARLRHWAERFGLPRIEAGWAGGNELKIAFDDPVSGTQLHLADAASGSSQGILLASQLLLTPPRSTLLLEEPENDMHPRFEKLLPELFAESVRGGRQVIATTHSEILVAALGNAVRKGVLRPDEVAVHHLERNEKGIKADNIRVSDRGYLDGWVKSFAAVEEELFDEWSRGLPAERPARDRGHARPSGSRARPEAGKRKKRPTTP